MQKQSRNKHLKEHLALLEAHAHAAKKQADIGEIAAKVEAYASTNDYKFNNTLPIIGLGFAALCGLLYVWGQLNISDNQRFILFLICIVTGLGSLTLVVTRYSRIDAVSALLYARAVAIRAGIERDYSFNRKQYYQELRHIFSFFNNGDEGQTITKRYSGKIDKTDFTLLEFKYINTSKRSSSNSSQKQRTTHYKYAMLTQFSHFNYLAVNVKKFDSKWDSTNSRFNKLFKIRGSNDILVAKFFDPKTVLAFVDNYSFVKAIDASSTSYACIEVPKEVFPSKVKSNSLRNSKQFIQDLYNPVSIPLLEKTKELVQLINKQQ